MAETCVVIMSPVQGAREERPSSRGKAAHRCPGESRLVCSRNRKQEDWVGKRGLSALKRLAEHGHMRTSKLDTEGVFHRKCSGKYLEGFN